MSVDLGNNTYFKNWFVEVFSGKAKGSLNVGVRWVEGILFENGAWF